jgi:hypothetical protein
MAGAHGARLGLAGAARPLFTHRPRLDVNFIRQDYFYPAFRNELTVSLRASADLFARSTITIEGLTHTLSPNGALNVTENASTSPAPAFEPRADWEQSAGSLLLTVAPSGAARTIT